MTDIKKMIKNHFGEVERIEAARGMYQDNSLVETDYPKPVSRHFLISESFGLSVEENYFWIKDIINEFGFVEMDKLVDTFTASEQSAFFGSAQQRLGLQQDRVSGYLATIGKMVKEMFQVVRDIKLLEEREELYKLAAQGDDGAEKSLKGTWIDFIDNGPSGVKASSVYGLASQLGYNVLPDLFFSAPAALKKEDVTKYVYDKLHDFNDKVKTVLVRKLIQYTTWRDATSSEISSKKRFTVQYLRQHYNSIKLYMGWVKPYLVNVKRLGMNAETQLSTEIVGAFEGSIIEIEFLAKKPAKPGEPRQCILASFKFRTRPVMQTGQDYQRGPVHLGRMDVTLRAYVWDDKDIAAYKAIKQEEDFEMLKSIDSSVEQAMDYLGDDLKRYLTGYSEKFGEKEVQIDRIARSLVQSGVSPNMEEARKRAEISLEGFKSRDTESSVYVERVAKSLYDSGVANNMEDARKSAEGMLKKGKPEGPSMFEPFTAIVSGFTGLYKDLSPVSKDNKNKKPNRNERKKQEEFKEKKKELTKKFYPVFSKIYTLYKKSHKLFTP